MVRPGGAGGRLVRSCAALVAALALSPTAGFAATIPVNTTADEFDTGAACSLREGLEAAHLDLAFGGCDPGSGVDTIELPSGTYALTHTGQEAGQPREFNDLDVSTPLTIRNASRGPAIIDGIGAHRVLQVNAPTPGVTLVGLTIRNGSLLSDGGGIDNSGVLTVRDSTVSGNFADDGEGGGIYTDTDDASVTLENVTVSANRADESGGGFSSGGGQNVVRSSTFTGNVADADQAGAAAGTGGVFGSGGVTSLRDTIVAGNRDLTAVQDSFAPDCSGQGLGSDGNNLIGDATGCGSLTLAPMPTDLVGADAALGPLADNGGPAVTHALGSGSTALDKGSASAPPVDQRGAPRAGAADIGAYERVLCSRVVVNRIGTAAGDRLVGTPSADGFLGLGGGDSLRGLNGGDAICAAGGRDRLIGGAGPDRLLGGTGRDRLLGGKGRDRLLGGPGRDRLLGGPGRDRLRGGPGRDRQRQ